MRSFLKPFALLPLALSVVHAEVVTRITPETIVPAKSPWTCKDIGTIPGQAGSLIRIGAGGVARKSVTLSTDREHEGDTWLWFSAGVWGKSGGGEGNLSLRVKDAAGTTVLAQTTRSVPDEVTFVSWSLYSGEALSPNNGRGADRATDGSLANEWVSTPKNPEDLYFDLVIRENRKISGLRYLPRPNGSTTGQVYDFEISAGGSKDDLSLVTRGSWPDGPGWKEVRFPQPVTASRIRLKALRTGNLPEKPSQIAMAAGEIEPLFDPDVSTIGKDARLPPQEIVVKVPASTLASLRGKSVVFEIENTGSNAVVLGNVVAAELAARPPDRQFNVRHSEYIDLNAIGLTGFTSENWSALQVHDVVKNSPADRAGLAPGELILTVDGHRLPPPRLEATRYPRDQEWLERHHEPFIARLYADALAKGRTTLDFETWNPATNRSAIHKLPLPSPNPAAWEGFPLHGAKADEFYKDLIDQILREQKSDGSWKNMPASMSEAFGIMALLGTKNPGNATAIYRAADYLLAQEPAGGSSHYLGLWDIAFRTMGLGEYALATGDPRAIAWLDTTCNALVQGAHVNRSNYFAFGHDRRGLPYGISGLLAPLSHMIIGDSLARRAGIDSGVARIFDPYIRAGWAGMQPVGKQSQGYGAPARGSDADQAWCRSGLVALDCHLRAENEDIKNGLVAFMGEHSGFMRRSHGYGNPGSQLGLMALAGASPETFKSVMETWAPVFAMQWVPGKGLRHVESQITNTFAKDPESSARVFSYSMAVVLSARHEGLHVTGSTARNWLPVPPNALPPAPQLIRDVDGGIRELRPALSDYVTVRCTTDGTEPTSKSPVWNPGLKPAAKPLRVAYEARNGKVGPAAVIATDGAPANAWEVLQADCAFPKLIHGVDNIEQLSIERAQYAFDANPSTWFRTNNGIRGETSGSELTWSVTVSHRGAENETPVVRGWVFPSAPEERSKVNDSAKSVRIETSADGETWDLLVAVDIPGNRRVMLDRSVRSPYLRFTFTSFSGTLLILPDVEFITNPGS